MQAFSLPHHHIHTTVTSTTSTQPHPVSPSTATLDHIMMMASSISSCSSSRCVQVHSRQRAAAVAPSRNLRSGVARGSSAQRSSRTPHQQHLYQQQRRSSHVAAAAPQGTNDVEAVADMIAALPLDEQQKSSLESLTNTLGVPLGTAKAMVFKKRGLLQLAPDEILDRVRQVADVVGVTTDQAIDMVTIQPGLLFDTQRNAEALALGVRAICYELNASKDEVVELILKNQSVLHGREMHLSVADIAHLAMLREPSGRIAE